MQLTVNLLDPEEVSAAIRILTGSTDNAQPSVPISPRTLEVIKAGNDILKGATPLAQPAPSTVVAGQSTTAQEVPQVTSAPQAPATTSTAQVSDPLAAAAPAAPTTPAVDAKGSPWDHRIHASSKALNADGTWRAKRGVDAALVAQVEAELRTVPAATPTLNQLDPAAVFGAAPAPAPVAAPAPSATPTTMAELMPRVSNAVVAGKLTPTALGDACMQVGLANVIALNAAPQLVPQVFAVLQQACGDL